MTPSQPRIQVEDTVRIDATPRDENGDPVNADVTWGSLDEAVATVNGGGLVTGQAEGTAEITATADGVADTATVDVVAASSTPSGESPSPDSNDRILFDTRAGGAQSLQSASSRSEAVAPFTFVSEAPGIEFTTDFDGQGTSAFIVNWNGVGSNYGDRARDFHVTLPSPKPREMYLQWKMWHGRTATSVSRGEGVGDQGAFDFTNENDPVGNAGAKRLRILRTVPDLGSGWSFDWLYGGPSPINAFVAAGNAIWNGEFGVNQNGDARWVPDGIHGEVVTTTVYARAASSSGAGDGVLRVWVNGILRMDRTNMTWEDYGFDRFQFPTVMRSPRFDMTEYFWDIVAWEPQ